MLILVEKKWLYVGNCSIAIISSPNIYGDGTLTTFSGVRTQVCLRQLR